MERMLIINESPAWAVGIQVNPKGPMFEVHEINNIGISDEFKAYLNGVFDKKEKEAHV